MRVMRKMNQPTGGTVAAPDEPRLRSAESDGRRDALADADIRREYALAYRATVEAAYVNAAAATENGCVADCPPKAVGEAANLSSVTDRQPALYFAPAVRRLVTAFGRRSLLLRLAVAPTLRAASWLSTRPQAAASR
jgi:hypothetical protein